MVKSRNVGISSIHLHINSKDVSEAPPDTCPVKKRRSGLFFERKLVFASYGNCMFERQTWWRSQFHQFPFCVILLALPFLGGVVLVLEDGKWFNHRYYIDNMCVDGGNVVYRSLAMTVQYTILASKRRVHGNYSFAMFTIHHESATGPWHGHQPVTCKLFILDCFCLGVFGVLQPKSTCMNGWKCVFLFGTDVTLSYMYYLVVCDCHISKRFNLVCYTVKCITFPSCVSSAGSKSKKQLEAHCAILV